MAKIPKDKVIGYGICGKGEADRYLKKTLECFKRLTDETVILINGEAPKEEEMIKSYGFDVVHDDREWGKNQWKIKQDFVKNVVAGYKPAYTICLDMDEELETTKEEVKEWLDKYHSMYVYIVNLWGRGYNKQYSFWNVRGFAWRKLDDMGDFFFEFEQKPLHCGLAPKWAYYLHQYSPFVLLHHGLKLKKDRDKKIERYKKYDPEQKHLNQPDYYKELEKSTFDALNLDKIKQQVAQEVKDINQPIKDPIILRPKQKETVFVRRQHDGLVFDVPVDRIDNQLQQKYNHKGDVYGFELV